MLTEVQLSNKRLMKALKRINSRPALGHYAKLKSQYEQVRTERLKEYYAIQNTQRMLQEQRSVFSKVKSAVKNFFRRNTK